MALKVSVASVTTAYNGMGVLPRHIDALLGQSRPLQQIIVVDNASTDGTGAMLADRYPQVTVLRMQKNVGAAGGWAAGLAYATGKGHDWVWNFDDDSVPGADALDTLLSGAQMVNGDHRLGMLAPLPVHEATGILYPPLLWQEGFVKPGADLLRRPIWFADLAIASGCMVRREVVASVGLPRSDFFMDFFDFEYCLRVRSQGMSIAVVTDCKFSHAIGNARHIQLPGFNRLWTDYAPWREYYLSRNMFYAGWHLYPKWRTKRFMTMHLLRHGCGVFLFGKDKSKCILRMLQGASDGTRGNLGVRFLPG
jgi:rhamnopyranosyl-N-acetylglucosaminyl-diphospho-decaprenol beta-1,3/1,4-galactofuranosyltransferase